MTKIEDRLTNDRDEMLRTVDDIGPVNSPAKYEAATHLLSMAKELAKKIREHYAPLKQKAHDTHKAIVAAENEMLSPVLTVQERLNGALDVYERQLKEEAHIAEAAAQKAAEDAIIQRAAALEEAGMVEEAERILDSPVPAVVVDSKPPKVAGVSVRRIWDFEVVDESKIALEFMVPDLVKIRKAVRAHGQRAPKVVGQGIRVFERTIRAKR